MFLPSGSLQYISVFWNDPLVLSIIPGGQWAGTDRPALGTGGKEGGKMRFSLSLSLCAPVWDPPPIICCDSFWRFWRWCSFGNMFTIFFVLHRTLEHESHDAKHEHIGHKKKQVLWSSMGREGGRSIASCTSKTWPYTAHTKTSPLKIDEGGITSCTTKTQPYRTQKNKSCEVPWGEHNVLHYKNTTIEDTKEQVLRSSVRGA
jgi:hypothetical protein